MGANENEIKIAVLEEQMRGLREQQKAHSEKTEESLKVLSDQVKNLFEAINKGKGIFTASLVFAGAIGAIISKITYSFFGFMAR